MRGSKISASGREEADVGMRLESHLGLGTAATTNLAEVKVFRGAVAVGHEVA